jgi:predicted RNA binding protein YcfA (HicA-like mRNA interferase family)
LNILCLTLLITVYFGRLWYLARQQGSHRQYKHKNKKGLVTISAHKMSDDVPPGTFNSIVKQAKIK